MPRFSHFLAAAFALTALPATAQTFIDVQRETSATSNAFGEAQTFQAFDGGTLSASDYYRYNGFPNPNNASYAGPEPAPAFTLPALRFSNLRVDAVNVFFVQTTDGLTMYWISGPGGSGPNRRVEAVHTVRRGAFVAPLARQDDNGDTFTFSSGNTALTTDMGYASSKTDGFAVLLTTAQFVVDTELTTAVSVAASPNWRVHQPNGTTIDFATQVGRALRFGPSGLRIADTPAVFDGPGWRLLSAPLTGISVNDFAVQNLVQGVAAGGAFGSQYPAASTNPFDAYNGGGRTDYAPVASTATTFTPGRGLWWYWYDVDYDPRANGNLTGTSVSRDLAGFRLRASGTEVTTDVSLTFTDNIDNASNGPPPRNAPGPGGLAVPADDDFYHIGNPYPRPLAVSAITATGGQLMDAAFIWNAGNAGGQAPTTPDAALDGPGSYEIVFKTPPDTTPDSVAVWNGLVVEVEETTTGGQITLDIARSGSLGTGAPPFYGRTAPEPYVHLTLAGTTASGARVRDGAAYVRFRDDASVGRDRFDASKPTPPSDTYALVAPVSPAGMRQAVLSLPLDASSPSVPLAFLATEAGTYTLGWDGTALGATLVDTETRTRTPLDAGGTYTFAAEASGWTQRFVLEYARIVGTEDTPDVRASVSGPTPNPATDAFRLDLRLADTAPAQITLVDVLGRRVRTVEARGSGTVTVVTDGLAAGAYAVIVEAPGLFETRRVTVVR